MKIVSRILPLFVALLLTVPAFAQFGSISGTVIGPDGNVLVGITVTIDRIGINQHFEVKTNDKGEYFHAGLPAASYKVSLLQDGQLLTYRDNVRISGEVLGADFNLKLLAEQMAQQMAGALPQLTPEEEAAIAAERAAAEASKNSFDEGIVALQAKNYPEAARLFQTAAENDATQHVIFGNLGDALSGARQYDESAAAYRKALELAPMEVAYYNNLGIALGNGGKIEEAIEALQKAAELNPAGAGQAYFNLGAILTNRGRAADAVEAFKKAIEVDATMKQAYLQLGISLFANQRTMKDAVPVLEKFLTMSPTPTDAETAKQLIEVAKSMPEGN